MKGKLLMITPHVKGSKWEITYKISGYKKVFSERFDTIEEANLRIAEIEVERKHKTLRPPKSSKLDKPITLSELLDKFLEEYGTQHWGESYYSSALRRINNYIKPNIGDMLIRDIDAPFLDDFYQNLLNSSAKKRIGIADAKITYATVDRVHVILRSALNFAVRRGYISSNPAMFVKAPKGAKHVREVWTVDEARLAIESCDNELLKLAMMLSIGCSLRLGEVLGLQWNNIFVSEDTIAKGNSYLIVKQELKRCDKSIVSKLDLAKRGDIYFEFPIIIPNSKTVLVLKNPKTESSKRKVFIPKTVAETLLAHKAQQEKQKALCGEAYEDYKLVIALENGRPCEPRIIQTYLRRLQKKTGLRPVVFHSLRHLSTSLKLQISGGDLKAVQGDTGHSQSKMVMDVYAHTFDQNRQELASKFDAMFFESPELHQDDKKMQLMELLDSNPQLLEGILNLAKAYVDNKQG